MPVHKWPICRLWTGTIYTHTNPQILAMGTGGPPWPGETQRISHPHILNSRATSIPNPDIEGLAYCGYRQVPAPLSARHASLSSQKICLQDPPAYACASPNPASMADFSMPAAISCSSRKIARVSAERNRLAASITSAGTSIVKNRACVRLASCFLNSEGPATWGGQLFDNP